MVAFMDLIVWNRMIPQRNGEARHRSWMLCFVIFMTFDFTYKYVAQGKNPAPLFLIVLRFGFYFVGLNEVDVAVRANNK